MRSSDWSSDVCSSDLSQELVDRRRSQELRGAHQGADRTVRRLRGAARSARQRCVHDRREHRRSRWPVDRLQGVPRLAGWQGVRSEEHTSELQSLMRISYAVFCLQKKKQIANNTTLKPSTR